MHGGASHLSAFMCPIFFIFCEVIILKRIAAVVLSLVVVCALAVPAFAAPVGRDLAGYLGDSVQSGNDVRIPLNIPVDWRLMADGLSDPPVSFGESARPVRPIGNGYDVSSIPISMTGNTGEYFGAGYYPMLFEVYGDYGVRPGIVFSSSGLPGASDVARSYSLSVMMSVSLSASSEPFQTGLTPSVHLYTFDDSLNLLDIFTVSQSAIYPGTSTDLIFTVPLNLDGSSYWGIIVDFSGASSQAPTSTTLTVSAVNYAISYTVNKNLEDQLADFRESLDVINSQVFPDLSNWDFSLSDVLNLESVEHLTLIFSPVYESPIMQKLFYVCAIGAITAFIIFGRRQ